MGYACKIGTHTIKLISRSIRKPIAEGPQHSHTGIVGGTSTYADEESATTATEGIENHLPGAVGGSLQRITFRF